MNPILEGKPIRTEKCPNAQMMVEHLSHEFQYNGWPAWCEGIAKNKNREGDQPMPVPNENPAIQDLVIADIETRKKVGLARYNTLLQVGNGRDMLRDAYDEALDLCIYLRGAIEERDYRPPPPGVEMPVSLDQLPESVVKQIVEDHEADAMPGPAIPTYAEGSGDDTPEHD